MNREAKRRLRTIALYPVTLFATGLFIAGAAIALAGASLLYWSNDIH